MTSIAATLADIRKTLIVVAAVAAQAVEFGVLSGTALHVAQLVSTVVAAVLVYVVPNGPLSKLLDGIEGMDDSDLQAPAVQPAELEPVPVHHPMPGSTIVSDQAVVEQLKTQIAASTPAPSTPDPT